MRWLLVSDFNFPSPDLLPAKPPLALSPPLMRLVRASHPKRYLAFRRAPLMLYSLLILSPDWELSQCAFRSGS